MIKMQTDPRRMTITHSDLCNPELAYYFWLGADTLSYPGILSYNELLIAVNDHTHDDRYYTQAEVDDLLSDGSEAGNMIGESKIWFGLSAPDKWLLLNGDSIGNAASMAIYSHDDFEPLFVFLWSNIANADCPVSGGRGADATSDFAAGKTLTILDCRGRVIVGAGQGAGLTNRVLGGKMGEEAHANTTNENVSHTHNLPTIPVNVYPWSAPNFALCYQYTSITPYQGDTGFSGSGQAHNNMQPSLIANMIIYSGVSLS